MIVVLCRCEMNTSRFWCVCVFVYSFNNKNKKSNKVNSTLFVMLLISMSFRLCELSHVRHSKKTFFDQ